MTTARPKILVTRPREDAITTQNAFEAAGFETLSSPLLEITPLDFSLPDLASYQGLLFTSQAGVRFFKNSLQAPLPPDIRFFTVGDQTAETAKQCGFDPVFSAQGTGADLVALVQSHTTNFSKPYLYLRGDLVARPLRPLCEICGIVLHEKRVYKACPLPTFTPETLSALKAGQISAVLFFSKRTAAIFLDIITRLAMEYTLATINALCISESVLVCVHPAPWRGAYSAKHPNGKSLLDLAERVCLREV